MTTLTQHVSNLAIFMGGVVKSKASLAGAAFSGHVTTPSAAIGATPGGVLYEMNSGGYYDPCLLQLADVVPDGQEALSPSMFELFRFYNARPAAIIQIGKSRGDGIPGSPTMYRPTPANDQIGQINFYGSSGAGFAHAGNIGVVSDFAYSGVTGAEVPVMLYCQGTPTEFGNGNGWYINSRAQMEIPGPNRVRSAPGTDYGAILRIGPGGSNMPPLCLTPAPLCQVLTPGAIEQDAAGVFYLTAGVAGAATRRRVATSIKPAGVTSVNTYGNGAATTRLGDDFIELTIVVGASDMVLSGDQNQIARVIFSSQFPVVPVLVGSFSGGDDYGFVGNFSYPTNGLKDRVFVSPTGALTLKAGKTYTWCILWRLP